MRTLTIGGAGEHLTNIKNMVGWDDNLIVNGGTSDELTGVVASAALATAFNHICTAQPLSQSTAPDLNPCEPNGICTTFVDQAGYLNEDCACNSGWQGADCDKPCDLGPDDRVDVAIIMDVSGSNVDEVSHLSIFCSFLYR